MGIYQNIKNLLLPSYTLQVDNMSTTKRHSILRHLTIAILILAIWTGTTRRDKSAITGERNVLLRRLMAQNSQKTSVYRIGGACGVRIRKNGHLHRAGTGAVKIVNKDSRRPTGFCRLNNELA